MSKKILLNKSPEGFGLSYEALEKYLELSETPFYYHTENFRPVYLRIPVVNYKAEVAKAKNGNELKELNAKYVISAHNIDRSDPALWEVSQKMGIEAMQDSYSRLVFEEIDDEYDWCIKEINNIEYLAIDINPKPKFTGKSEHWYSVNFRPEWMKDDDLVIFTGKGVTPASYSNAEPLVFNTITTWRSVISGEHDFYNDALWYPLQKLNPLLN
jgi:hypothetical protein